jgi:hypothetical protein
MFLLNYYTPLQPVQPDEEDYFWIQIEDFVEVSNIIIPSNAFIEDKYNSHHNVVL